MTSMNSANNEHKTRTNGDNEDLEPGNLLHADHKPRLLLMGLKRYVTDVLLDTRSISDRDPQEWEIVDIERGFPQDGASRNPVPGNHHDDPQRGYAVSDALRTIFPLLIPILSSFMDFQVWDLPGQIDYLDPDFDAESIFGGVGAMIWVLDAIDNYMEPVSRLTETILHLQHSYPDIKYSVFIHKVDSLTEDFRDDTMRDVRQRITDDLYDAGLENPPITYYGTSIYDHSIFEAFSKVMQGLVPQLPTFEALLNTVSANCRFEKAYLFDVYSKVYIASDTTPVDMKAYELCADLIDIIVDMSEVYGWDRGQDQQETDRSQAVAAPSAESFVSNIKGYHLYLKEINRSALRAQVRQGFRLTIYRNLSFIGISKYSDFEISKVLVDQNMQAFQDTLLKVFPRG